MISNIDKKGEKATSNKTDQDMVKSFTNSEEIKDFYEYTSECLKRVSILNKPTKQELQDLYLNLPISDEELQSKI